MINVEIPGYGEISITNLILDYNGTIAKDGLLIDGLDEKINKLAALDVNVYIITADTNGTALTQCNHINANVLVVQKDRVAQDKLELVQKLGVENCFAVGNGRNDYLMLEASKLGVCVISSEGLYANNFEVSDIVVSDINDALDLLLFPNRLIATLRG